MKMYLSRQQRSTRSTCRRSASCSMRPSAPRYVSFRLSNTSGSAACGHGDGGGLNGVRVQGCSMHTRTHTHTHLQFDAVPRGVPHGRGGVVQQV